MNISTYNRAVLFAASLLTIPARAEIPGTIEPGYVVRIGTDGHLFGMAIQSEGKVFIQGQFKTINNLPQNKFVRLTADGIVDTTFNAATLDTIGPMAVLPGGKVFIYGWRRGTSIDTWITARLNADGSEDPTFTISTWPVGQVWSVASQPDGKILLAGFFTKQAGEPQATIMRLNVDGSQDPGFTASMNGEVSAMAVQPDGKILIAGRFSAVNGAQRNRIARLNEDGTLEGTATFNPGTGPDKDVLSLALQPDGKILVGGAFYGFNGARRMNLARLSANGTIEATTSFSSPTIAPKETQTDPSGRPTFPSAVCSIALQADGKILLAGSFMRVGGAMQPRMIRLLANGTLEGKNVFYPHIGQEKNPAFQEFPSWDQMTNPMGILRSDGRIILGCYHVERETGRFVQNYVTKMANDPATETISSNGNAVYWMRGGSAPEVSYVTFDLSEDGGVTWKRLGPGTRIRGRWQCAGLKMPARGTLRASGSVPSSFRYGNVGLVEKVVPLAAVALPRKL